MGIRRGRKSGEEKRPLEVSLKRLAVQITELLGVCLVRGAGLVLLPYLNCHSGDYSEAVNLKGSGYKLGFSWGSSD